MLMDPGEEDVASLKQRDTRLFNIYQKTRDRRKYAKERDKIEEMFKNDFFVI